MFLRPCFLVVDREFAGSISSRKLVIETAKFNVITAYSVEEARATLERFPQVHGVVVSAGPDGQMEDFLRSVKLSHPELKLVLTGHTMEEDVPWDAHVESYSPDNVLRALRKLFPEASATVEQIEQKLEAEATSAAAS